MLKQWTETRWDSIYESISLIIRNYAALLSALETLIEDGSDRAVDGQDLLISMKYSTFVVTGFVLLRLLGPIKILNNQLKGKHCRLERNGSQFRSYCKRLNDDLKDRFFFCSKLSQWIMAALKNFCARLPIILQCSTTNNNSKASTKTL